MRIEANVSVSSTEEFGTKVEVKNLNSFRSVERAIAYEIERQSALIKGGERVLQETRGWNEVREETFSQRLKEGSADYRYFPEPDLPKLRLEEIGEFAPDAVRSALPELPWERRKRYTESFALKKEDVNFLILPERSAFFDLLVIELGEDKKTVTLAANYFISDLGGEVGAVTPTSFAKLIKMIAGGSLSSRGAKEVLSVMKAAGGEPEAIAGEKGILQIEDRDLLKKAVQEVISAHPSVAADYKNGKEAALQFLVGQAMKAIA